VGGAHLTAEQLELGAQRLDALVGAIGNVADGGELRADRRVPSSAASRTATSSARIASVP
jgi:hypothetical protein